MIIKLFLTFFKLGALTFGGGYAMVAMMEEECVEKKNFITKEEFLNIVTIAESTPGPLSVNLATYIGHKQLGLLGAFVSTLGVVLPSIFVIYIISVFFENIFEINIIKNAFVGIRIAIGIIIVRSSLNLFCEEYKNTKYKIISITLFVIYFFIVFITEIINKPISTVYYIFFAFIISIVLLMVKKNDLF